MSVLCVPKLSLDREDLVDFLRSIGFGSSLKPGSDLVPLGSDPAFLRAVLNSLQAGTSREVGRAEAN